MAQYLRDTHTHRRSRRCGWWRRTRGSPSTGRSSQGIWSCRPAGDRWSPETASLGPHSRPGTGSCSPEGILRTRRVWAGRSTARGYRLWRGERFIRWMLNTLFQQHDRLNQLQVERRESHRDNQVYALTTHQLQVERRERVIETIKCIRSPHTSYRWRGERDIETIKCMRSPHTSYRWRGERVIETIKCMLSPHTSYRWREERVIETIKCMRSPHTSYRWRGERVIETIKCMRSPHTATGGEERES